MSQSDSPESVVINHERAISNLPVCNSSELFPVESLDWPAKCGQWRHSSDLTEAEWLIVEEYGIRHGCQYDSYLAIRPSTDIFFSRPKAKGLSAL